jgi:hypothetical protein
MILRSEFTNIVAIIAITVGLASCHDSEYVRWDPTGMPARINPATNQAIYRYVYYPNLQVYFEPYSEIYWWFQDEAWYEGNRLPEGTTVRHEYFQFIELATPKPWTHHVTVHSGFNREYLPKSIDPSNYEIDVNTKAIAVESNAVYE